MLFRRSLFVIRKYVIQLGRWLVEVCGYSASFVYLWIATFSDLSRICGLLCDQNSFKMGGGDLVSIRYPYFLIVAMTNTKKKQSKIL